MPTKDKNRIDGNGIAGADENDPPAALARTIGSGPLLWSMVLFLLLLGTVLAVSLRLNHGSIGYAAEDAYGQMSMARGLERNGFGPAAPNGSFNSLSPLWTLLLALTFRLCGAHEILPFLLNGLAAIGAIFAFHRMVRPRVPGGPRTSFALNLALIVFTPLVPLVFAGGEQVLQLLLTLLFADLSARTLSGGRESLGWAERPFFWILVAVLPLVRPESLFLILPVCLLLLRRRRPRVALPAGLLALLSLLACGTIGPARGWYANPYAPLIRAQLLSGYWAYSDIFGTVRSRVGNYVVIPVRNKLVTRVGN